MARRRAFSPAAFVTVVLGGAVGVALRAVFVIPLATADPIVVPTVTAAINILGSFLLGVLVGWVADRRPLTRAFLGTGVLGGFTTYSAFAVHIVELGGAAPIVSLLAAGVSLFGGVLAAALGLRLGEVIAGAPGRLEPPEAAE